MKEKTFPLVNDVNNLIEDSMKYIVQKVQPALIILVGIALMGIQLDNPIGSNDQTLLQFIVEVTRVLLGGVAVFALVMIIYGGFLILTAAGKQDMIEKGRDTLLWAVIGLGVILFSGVIVRFLFAEFTNAVLFS